MVSLSFRQWYLNTYFIFKALWMNTGWLLFTWLTENILKSQSVLTAQPQLVICLCSKSLVVSSYCVGCRLEVCCSWLWNKTNKGRLHSGAVERNHQFYVRNRHKIIYTQYTCFLQIYLQEPQWKKWICKKKDFILLH